jgi:hypothetical protein
MRSLPRLQRTCGNHQLREHCAQTAAPHRSVSRPSRLAQISTNHRKPANPSGARNHYFTGEPIPAPYEENDHVQDCFGPRFRDGRHLRRSGVCCSHDLRTQHNAVRQLRHLDRPILRLTRDESVKRRAPALCRRPANLKATDRVRPNDRRVAGVRACCCNRWPLPPRLPDRDAAHSMRRGPTGPRAPTTHCPG